MDTSRIAVVALALLLMLRSAVAPLGLPAVDGVLLVLGLAVAAAVPWTCVAIHRRQPTPSNRLAVIWSIVGLGALLVHLALSAGEDGTSVGTGLVALVALVGLVVGALTTSRHAAGPPSHLA
ncbi:hypothetical protein [Aeromicrobium sp. IC_218]|uniref:hypothetical protein n=1 Tax=Aeromicrobium sp. IC_218 TaxID=2545468 RepID=UPI00103B1383|nr:hypothetical protein [Aeromicrobium sp. IC_218]TCI97677.1 hypothetical protein E0W78_11560 [Aeromicrobium sp. IC_218]